jgi:hypothetical protein
MFEQSNLKNIIGLIKIFQADRTSSASGPKYPSWDACSPQGALLFDVTRYQVKWNSVGRQSLSFQRLNTFLLVQ